MDSREIFNHIAGLELKCSMQEKALMEKEVNSVDAAKFYSVSLTTEEVARLHGVSTSRVRDYAARGLIELHPNSTDAKLMFRASTVLTMDFDKLKREKAHLKR